MSEGDRAVEVIDVVGCAVRRTIAAELQRLARRTDLSAREIDVVAATLERLSSILVLEPVDAWRGDPGLLADLLVPANITMKDDSCPN